jgi:colanic acid biosynthesis protein WcaH
LTSAQDDDLQGLLDRLERRLGDGAGPWPDALFQFISRTTPLVNVDLLIQDPAARTLLTWRSDEYYGPGWHVPGGVIRFQESAGDRIRAVAALELGTSVEFDAAPIAVHECIARARRNRGHFVSLLYRCRVLHGPAPALENRAAAPLAGQWRWHAGCPHDLIPEQRAYAAFLG